MVECKTCALIFNEGELKKNMWICPKCGRHLRLPAKVRIEMTVDEGSFEEFEADGIGGNLLDFPGYEEKLKQARELTGLKEAVITGVGTIGGEPVIVCAMDGRFLMGSMGAAVGEKITRAFEKAVQNRLPVVCFSVSGGARMQEGIISLMQMAKTADAVRLHSEAGLLFISVLTDPTTGGVLASFAGLGDIILAEPNAYIGFAGKRVIENTMGQSLPKGFQTGEFYEEKGFVDRIVHRSDMKSTLEKLLKLHKEANG